MAHFQRGLAAKAGQPMDEQTAALLYGLGRTEVALFMQDEAVSHLATAFDYYAQSGDVQRSLAVASMPFAEGRGYDLMAPVVERALQLAPPESVDTGWLLCTRGRYLGINTQDREGARALFSSALVIAQRIGNQRLELRAWATWAVVAYHNAWVEDEEEPIEESLRLLESVDSPWDEQIVRNARTNQSVWMDDAQTAMALANLGLAAAERTRDRARLASAIQWNQLVAQNTGDWASARSLFRPDAGGTS